MKKLYILSMLAVLVIGLSSAVEKVQKSAGPPSCHAGEPPNRTTCVACHYDATLNTGTADVLLDLGGADTVYVPGQTYTITITVSKPGMERAGFQCIALRDDNDKISPGTVTLTDMLRTQVLDKSAPHPGGCLNEERVWTEHTYAGNSSNDSGVSRWSYSWRAPQDGVGSITFYLAVLEADNDLSETGDHVYTVQKTIAGLPVGVRETASLNDLRVYVQPLSGMLRVDYRGQRPGYIALYSVTGKKMKDWTQPESSADGSTNLDVGDLDVGMYIVEVRTEGGEQALKKVMLYR